MSNGEQAKPPKFLRESEDKLMQEQKRLSRKKPKSNKRNKQRVKVAKVHRKIRNQRKDFAHKLSKKLVDSYDLIKFEDLRVFLLSSGKGFFHFINYDLIHIVDNPSNLILTT
jgi:putative transposase